MTGINDVSTVFEEERFYMCSLESKMKGPLVSIVVPVYNVESYIDECLQTVCSQTYKNLEIICVDDGGNDKSMDIVRSFAIKDCRIRIIEHEKNKGLAEARNTGVENVSGDYVFFLDSDDWLSLDAIEKLVRSAKMEEADIVVGHGRAFPDDDSKETHLVAESMNSWLTLPKEAEVRGKRMFLMMNRIPCVAWGKLFRSGFLLSNSLKFVPENLKHEDNGFHLKCFACSPAIRFVYDDVYYYRIRNDSIVGKLRGGGADHRSSKEDLRKVLDDAVGFVSVRNPTVVDYFRDSCWDTFAVRGFGCVFYWGRYWKCVRVGPVVLIKKGISTDGRVFLKVLGIKIYKKNVL